MPMSAEEVRSLPGWQHVEARWPGFALEDLRRIESIRLFRNPEGDVVNIEMSATNRRDSSGPLVVVRMMDVRSGRLPELDALWLAEFFVEDVSGDQLEGIRYYLYTESGTLHVYCRSIEVAIAQL